MWFEHVEISFSREEPHFSRIGMCIRTKKIKALYFSPMATVIVLRKETYLAMLHNAAGTNLFRNLYARVDRNIKDITEDGNLSCAFFASSVLFHFGLVKSVHASVSGFERDLKTAGWYEVVTPSEGEVLFWEPAAQVGGTHGHCGFFLGKDQAISNQDTVRTPHIHHVTFGTNLNGTPVRAITTAYTHNLLRQ